MKTLDFILPANGGATPAEMDTPAVPRSNGKSAEPFDKMMTRVLNKPREQGEKHSPIRKPASHPAAVRKSKPEVIAANSPGDAGFSRADSAGIERPADGASQDSEPSSRDETPMPANSNSTDDGLAVALQTLAVSLPVVQTVASNIFKAGPSDVPPGSVEVVGADSGSAPSLTPPIPDETASEMVGTTVKTESKPDSQASVGTGKKALPNGANPAKTSSPDDAPSALQALLDQSKPVKETPVNTSDLSTEKPPAPALTVAGTPTAEQAGTMKNADQSAKVAGLPEQSLPGVAVVTSAAQAVARSKPAAKASARVESSDVSAPVNSTAAHRPPSTAETSSSNLISASSQTELRARALDRTHDILALHGMQLKQSNTDSLQVVIKPGAGLQLSLQMKQTGEGIEAQAILQQGNFDDLNKHWAELQQKLEERGIRLAPLGQDRASANGGNENFQRQPNQPQPDAASAGAFAEFALIGAGAARPAPATTAARGWESWA